MKQGCKLCVSAYIPEIFCGFSVQNGSKSVHIRPWFAESPYWTYDESSSGRRRWTCRKAFSSMEQKPIAAVFRRFFEL